MEENKSAYQNRPLWQWIVVYLIIGVVVYGLIYYFVIAKKGEYNSMNSNPATVADPTPAISSGTITVSLNAQNDSGETGTAILKDENGKTAVTLNLAGFAADVPQPTHIHIGACPNVGAVKYPLTNVVNGSSATVLDVGMSELKQGLPLAINVHKSTTEAKVYVSCGDLTK